MGQLLRLSSKREDHFFNSLDPCNSFIQRGRKTEIIIKRKDKVAVKGLMSTE